MISYPAPAWRGVRPKGAGRRRPVPHPGLARRDLLIAAALAWTAGGPARADKARSLAPFTAPAPVPFSLKVLGGPTESLVASRGSVVLVHFFATWCEPCRPELASLDRLAADRATDLKVLAIDVAEPEARIARFFAERPVRFTILLDPDRAVSRAWGVEALPSSIILDRGLRPRLAVRGDLDWQRADVMAAIDRLTSEPARGADNKGEPT